MAMTREERGTKNWLYQHLLEEGYRTYAKLFWELDFHLTANPSVVGYMEPKTGTITVNRTLEADQISVIIRHEILHGFLQHEKRLLQNLAQKRGLDFDELSDMDIKELKNYLYRDSNFNIAGDYEISNLGYTEEDKDIVRNILLNGKTVSGLVTEDKHPDWVDLSIEEMYDKLQDERDDDQNQPQQPDESNSSDGDNSEGQDQQSQQSSNDQEQQNQDASGQQGDGGSDSQLQSTDSSQSSDQQQSEQNDQQSDQQQNSSSNSSNSSDNQQQSDQQSGDQGSGQGSDSSSEAPKYVYGKFIDKNTFLDANGNIVTIG